MIIRPATFDDLPDILDIHNDVLLSTTAIWDEKPTDLAERKLWMEERLSQNFPIFIALEGERMTGFGSYGTWRARQCYWPTVEHTVHVHRDHRRRGIGKALIRALIGHARAESKRVMIGGMTAENEASIRMHEALGFYESGRMKEVGYKFGCRLDLIFMQKMLD